MSRRPPIVLAAALAVAVPFLAASLASAAPHFDGSFPLPTTETNNKKLAAGPDGNMWVVIAEGANDVAKVKPDGSFEEFELDNLEGVSGIAMGPEHRMWVTSINQVSSFDVADPKGSTETTTIAEVTSDNPIVAGPDGQMWVAAKDGVVHFPPASPNAHGFVPVAELSPKDRDVAGSLLVVADSNHQRIVTLTTGGDVKDIPLLEGTNTSQGVAGSPNGQIAFSNSDGDEGLGLVTPPGAPTVLQMPGDPFGVARGSDGAYYTAMSAAHDVQRMTPDGRAAPIDGFPPAFFPRQIAAGPNDTVWVTMEIPGENVYAIARISGLEQPLPPPVPTTSAKPDTRIRKGPKGRLRTRKAKATVRFAFSSPTAGAGFECALTKRSSGKKKKKRPPKPRFRGCRSPKSYKLGPGRYTFRVRANLLGSKDPSPATRSFKLVRVRPHSHGVG
jgi:sugar lactone lactonase YvrE